MTGPQLAFGIRYSVDAPSLAYSDMESVVGPSRTVRQKDLLLSPGIRWSYNFKSGLQIVPGLACPMGVRPSAGKRGIIVYLSFEQPLKMLS